MSDATPAGSAETRQLSIDALEEEARRRLPHAVFDYYAGGAGDEWTLRENRRAFERWVLRPRFLIDVSDVDLRTTILGQEMPFPILVAPTALQRMAHSEGELATARGAAALGATMVVSTIATISLEDIAETGVNRWFQLYIHKDRDLTAELVKRAHAAGYGAVVVTVDTPFLGRRLRDERNRFTMPPGIGLANLAGIPLPQDPGSSLFRYFASQLDPALTWEDVAWVRSLSPLPVVLKGILTPEDAVLAVEAGVDGLVVSNHGGRQLDGVPATLDVLPEIVEAVGGRAEVLMDSGVRQGTDVLKALSLGARAVLVGRPVLWGLATGGDAGVRRVLEMMRDDLALTLALAGCSSVAGIDRTLVGPAPR
ncbi:MAG TPA: alpha-hydroxy acid oxidase [Actinomycetota bacterium]